MTTPEQPTPAPTAYGYCAWHQGYARNVRLIQVSDQGSGPCTASRHFACHLCRQAYDLIPLADLPL